MTIESRMSKPPRHRQVSARLCLALTALLFAAGTPLLAADEAATDPSTDNSTPDLTIPTIPRIPLTATQSFALAARKTFDPPVFVLSSIVAEFGRGADAPGYPSRYGT